MPESFKTRWQRRGFNFFPAYRRTGGRLTYLADDYHEIHVKLPLSWRTRNYVGTTFGGSMYGAIDPVYMIMLIKILGGDYVVWDKAATIRFKRPGRETLYAEFRIDADEIDAIKDELTRSKSTERIYRVSLVDGNGKVHAEVEKTLYISQKREAVTVAATEASAGVRAAAV
jgi:acyl-coenzyme A thioesterase PaaI-like protein